MISPLIEQELALKRALALQLDCVHDQNTTAQKRALSVLIASLSETLLMRDPSDLEAKVLFTANTRNQTGTKSKP